VTAVHALATGAVAALVLSPLQARVVERARSVEASAAGPVSFIDTPAVARLGTFEATIDGDRRTWYSVSGTSGERPYDSGAWLELPGGETLITAGGFDTPSPPMETFQWGENGMPTSFGDYRGSTLGIAVSTGDGTPPFSIEFPDDGVQSLISYQPVADLETMVETSFMLQEGTIHVSAAEISDGVARLEGTFSGTFRTLFGEETVEITDGVFQVQEIPGLTTLVR